MIKYRGKQNKSNEMRCDCGKLIAMVIDGKIVVKCRGCGRQIPLAFVESQEPKGKSQEP